MAAAIVALGVVTAIFLAGVWAVFFGLFSLLGAVVPVWGATVVTALLLLTIGCLEFRHLDTIEALAGARPVDSASERERELEGLAVRTAARFDVPPPTVLVAERETPEAMAVGFRPGNVHLVLSRGALDALADPDELEAVVAHELAHVANRDAMVMTAVSTPVVLAGGMLTRIERINEDDDAQDALAFVTVPLALLSMAVWFVGRSVTAHLSRERERAADRAAVDVTGSPAALAAALSRLDDEIQSTPSRDLREVSAVSSLSILPLEPEEPEKIMLGPEGDREPSYWWLRKRVHALFRSHPRTADRIERLSNAERGRRHR